MGAQEYAWDADELLSLSALIGLQSRGLPLAAEPRQPFLSEGAALFRQRMGQLNLSCAQCHEDRAGLKLAGSLIPQGHPNGYPEYRLEWQGMGSFYRRLRNCMVGTRAEPFAPDSREAASRAVPGGARQRHADRNPRRAAMIRGNTRQLTTHTTGRRLHRAPPASHASTRSIQTEWRRGLLPRWRNW